MVTVPIYTYCCLLALGAAGPAGLIAFVSGTTQDDQTVCVLEAASGSVTRIGPGHRDGPPVWSPDGGWLAFATAQGDGLGICIARPDASETRLVKHARAWNQDPRWSPDGTRLAYTAEADEPFRQRLTIYDIASGAESACGDEKVPLFRPVWLPNVKLLYGLKPDQEIDIGHAETATLEDLAALKDSSPMLALGLVGKPGAFSTDIFIVAATLTAPLPEWVLPSRGRYAEFAAEPSPDGTQLAFESNDGGDREIFVLNKRGAIDVSNDRAADWNPVWSPDSNWIAFESFRDGRRGLYRVFTDTGRVDPVAVTPDADNWWPAWSPDGEWIAFASTRTGDPEIFLARASGEDVKQLTNRPGLDSAPAWQPRPPKKPKSETKQ